MAGPAPPTIYGGALLKRSVAAFDELKQSRRDIAFLADPTVGEVRVGCPESLSAAILAPIIERFLESHPRVILHVDDLPLASLQLSQLRERKHDLILARIVKPLVGAEDVSVDILFDDRLVVATSRHSQWTHRRTIELRELVNEPWLMTPSDTWNYALLFEAFQAQRLDMPKASLVILSGVLRTRLLASGRYITSFAESVLRHLADRYDLKQLPIDLPNRPLPVAILTVKNRTLSPVVGRFVECAHDVAKSMVGKPQARKS
ncbi:MAG TPA: LysR family transcriptional regulator substrate-binding protein [Xanthobacteraceae bacterium]|jgi:DNA-binding transcriptional LysR family regulator